LERISHWRYVFFSPSVKEYLHEKYTFQNIFASNRPSYGTKIYLLSVNTFLAMIFFIHQILSLTATWTKRSTLEETPSYKLGTLNNYFLLGVCLWAIRTCQFLMDNTKFRMEDIRGSWKKPWEIRDLFSIRMTKKTIKSSPDWVTKTSTLKIQFLIHLSIELVLIKLISMLLLK